MSQLIKEFEGIISYFNEGTLHREDGPAVIHPNGSKEWWIHGRRHREDGPAIIRPGVREKWFLHDIRHRIDGPAVIDYNNGSEEWWEYGVRHRENGPALIKINKLNETIYGWWIKGVPIKSKKIKEIFGENIQIPLTYEETVLLKLILFE